MNFFITIIIIVKIIIIIIIVKFPSLSLFTWFFTIRFYHSDCYLHVLSNFIRSSMSPALVFLSLPLILMHAYVYCLYFLCLLIFLVKT